MRAFSIESVRGRQPGTRVHGPTLRALQRALLAAVVLTVVGVTYWRLWYGIDLTDEAFYVTIPYRFVRGAKPFVDELTVTQQTTGILLYPFVRAYYSAAGLTGIVLFLRHLQFVLSMLVGVVVYVSTRRPFGTTPAAAAALTAIVFVPFGIRGLSYNSVGCSLFTAGCFLGFHSLTVAASRRSRIAAGLCHGLAAFAYPPLVGAVACSLGARLLLRRAPRRRELLEYGVAALGLPVVGMGILAATAGVSQLAGDYRNSSRYLGQAGGLDKLTSIARHEWSTLRHGWYLTLALLVLFAFLRRRGSPFACAALVLLPVALLPPHPLFFGASLEFVASYSWLALPMLLAVRRSSGARRLMAAVWLPALVAGATTAYSSANGGINFGVGFFPATIVTSLMLALVFEQAWTARTTRLPPPALAAVPALAALAILCISSTIPIYHDSGLTRLDAVIRNGPYAGLVTSTGKRAYLQQLQTDLAADGPRCTITFFDDFPAGYLFTRARPDTPLAWIANVSPADTPSYQRILLRYFGRHGLPDIVVLERWIPFSFVYPHTGRHEYYHWSMPLLATIRRDYRLAIWRRPYAIYDRRGGSCAGTAHRPATTPA